MTAGLRTMNVALQHDMNSQHCDCSLICTDVDLNPAGEFWLRILLAALIIYKADETKLDYFVYFRKQTKQLDYFVYFRLRLEFKINSICRRKTVG
jgi:hypothetical protein